MSVEVQNVECQPHTVLVCLFFPGVSIQWNSTAYTVSEDSGTAQLVLIKEGTTEINASVEVIAVAGNATGETGQALLVAIKYLSFHIHVL